MNRTFNGSLPIQGTEVAASWDTLYWFIMAVSVFFFVLVIGAMVIFAIKYRHRPGVKTSYITHNVPLEVVWTVIPTIIVLVIFGWGWVVYKKMIDAPADAYEIRVIGKQWLWQFQYEDGRTYTNKFFVPENQPVKMLMTSDDVLHSFFIPNFRVKQDVVPGMYTTVWFQATVAGEHDVYCAEYCGTAHSNMLAKVVVLKEKDWKRFTRGKEIELASYGVQEKIPAYPVSERAIIESGRKLTQAKGCVACHSATGKQGIGPSYQGLFGSQRVMEDGTQVMADENYIRESIEKPEAKKVKGFASLVMPSFQGQVDEKEMNALVAYIKSLK